MWAILVYATVQALCGFMEGINLGCGFFWCPCSLGCSLLEAHIENSVALGCVAAFGRACLGFWGPV